MTPQSSTVSQQPSIELHIERLVLEGLPVSTSQGHVAAAAMEAELTRLFIIEGLAASASRAEPHLPAGHIHLVLDGGPRTIGQQIGAAVYRVLNQSTQTTTLRKRTPRDQAGADTTPRDPKPRDCK